MTKTAKSKTRPTVATLTKTLLTAAQLLSTITLTKKDPSIITLKDLTKDSPNVKIWHSETKPSELSYPKDPLKRFLNKNLSNEGKRRRRLVESTTVTNYKVAVDVTNLAEIRTKVTNGESK